MDRRFSAAAKNFHHVLPVTDPDDYEAILSGLKNDEGLSASTLAICT